MLTKHNIPAISNAQDQASQGVRSMSSVEIAELTGKRHDHVIRDIRNVLNQLEINAPHFWGTQTYGNGNTREVCNLPKDLTITLVSGYSVVMRHRIITRWQELEAQQEPVAKPVFNLPTNYLEALECLVVAEKEKIALTHQVEEMQPTVAAYDRLTNSDGTMTITDAAKQLGINPRALTKWLSDQKWIYKTQGGKSWLAHQPRLDSGCMMHKTVMVEKSDGKSTTYSQARVTAKGLATISKAIEKARQTTLIVGASA